LLGRSKDIGRGFERHCVDAVAERRLGRQFGLMRSAGSRICGSYPRGRTNHARRPSRSKAALVNFVRLAHTMLEKRAATLLKNLAIILESCQSLGTVDIIFAHYATLLWL
jgi:hypothetical protein